MSRDQIDEVIEDWLEERPDLSTEALGIVLRIQSAAKILADRVTKSLSDVGIEWWEYDVLSALRRQGAPYRMTASTIAKNVQLSTGALTNRVDGLVEKQLVERSEDPADRRRVIITLTKEGKKLVDRATVTRFTSADEALSYLAAGEQTKLNDSLRDLLVNFDESSIESVSIS